MPQAALYSLPALTCSPSFPPTAFIAKLNGLKALSIRLVPITALYALSRDGPVGKSGIPMHARWSASLPFPIGSWFSC